jgi:hypothetical protein
MRSGYQQLYPSKLNLGAILMRTDLTPHITIEQYKKLIEALSKINYPEPQIKYLNDIICFFKDVIRKDLNMELEMIARFPLAWNSNSSFWNNWAIESCKTTEETLENRLIWVRTVRSKSDLGGISLKARVNKIPESPEWAWRVTVCDDDAFFMHSRPLDSKESAIRFLDVIQWINDLSIMHLMLGGDP